MLKCQNCKSKDDVATFVVKNQSVTLCVHCRAELFGKKINTTGWKPEE